MDPITKLIIRTFLINGALLGCSMYFFDSLRDQKMEPSYYVFMIIGVGVFVTVIKVLRFIDMKEKQELLSDNPD